MFAFLLNPGRRRRHRRRNRAHPSLTYYKRHGGGRRHKVVHRRRHHRVISRSARARRSYWSRRVGATKTRYKSLAGRLLNRYICAPGASRRWHAARARCPVKSTAPAASADWSEAERSEYYNPRRRRRRRRNSTWIPSFANNPRRRRARFHYKRHRNTSWAPAFAMNGLNVKSLTTGFQPDMLMKGAVTLVGFIGNAFASRKISDLGFMPSFLKSGPGSYALGLSTAGVTSALIGMAAPQYAVSVLFGGVLQQVVKAYNEYVAPKAGFLPKLGSFDDYATVQDVKNARPLGCLFGGCGGGMGELFDPRMIPASNELFNADMVPYNTGLLGMGCMNGNCMGDYLSRENAANARPLGHLGYTLNDAAIESTATNELGSID